MDNYIKRRGVNSPFFSIVIVDSRSDQFPAWVKKALFSVEKQTLEDLEIIVIENLGRKYSIGKCFNEGLKLASSEWVYFLGDDDYLSFDYLASLKNYIENFTNDQTVIASTYCTFFSDDGKEVAAFDKMPMGAYRKSYFINHLFNEDLKKYVDVDRLKFALEDGKQCKICQWHYGYFYRQHYNNISGRKQIQKKELEVVDVEGITRDFYIVDKFGIYTNELKDYFNAVRSKIFIPELALKSKVIFCEYEKENLAAVKNWGGNQKKIVRVSLDDYYNVGDEINVKDFDLVLTSQDPDVIISGLYEILEEQK